MSPSCYQHKPTKKCFSRLSSIALIAGCLLLVGCDSKPESPLIKKETPIPKRDNDLADIRSDAAQAISYAQNDNPFPLPEEVNKAGLLQAIRQLANNEQLKLNKTQYTFLQLTRDEAGKRLIEGLEKLTEGERLIAINSRLEGLMNLRNLNYANAEDDLRIVAAQYENDSQANVAVAANLAKLKLELSDLLISNPDQLEPFFENVRVLIHKFPDNQLLAKLMESMVAGLFNQQQRGPAVQLMRLLEQEFSKSQDREISNVARAMRDQLVLAELNYDGVVKDLQQKRPGVDKEYEAIIEKILARPEMSLEIFRELQKSFQLLEVFNKYDLAKRVNARLEAAIANNQDINVVKVATFELEMSNRRLGKLGNPISIDATNGEGNQFDWEMYREKIVVVVFWSTQSEQSIQVLEKLKDLKSELRDPAFDVLAINVDINPENMEKHFSPKSEIVMLASSRIGDLGLGNDMAAEFGIREIPYMMIVDRDGIVQEINVHVNEIPSTVRRYLSK